MATSISAPHEAATSVRLALAAVHELIDDRARARPRDRTAPRPALRPPRQIVIAAAAADDDPAWREAARIRSDAVAQIERERLRRLRWAAIAGLVVALAACATVGAVLRADHARAALGRARLEHSAERDRVDRLRLRADAARAVAEARVRALRTVLSMVPFSPVPALVPAAFDAPLAPVRASRPRPRVVAPPAPPTGPFIPRCPDDVPLC